MFQVLFFLFQVNFLNCFAMCYCVNIYDAIDTERWRKQCRLKFILRSLTGALGSTIRDVEQGKGINSYCMENYFSHDMPSLASTFIYLV